MVRFLGGEGPERQSLEKLAVELGTTQQVIFDGLISSGDMPAYLNQLDAVVLASRTRSNWKEQFGRVIIEAMACEVPVVGSDSGEIPNVIGEAGLIFPEGDVQALSAHLKYLMDNVAVRQNLGKEGLRKVKSEYTQRRIAERTVDVYREMMARDG